MTSMRPSDEDLSRRLGQLYDYDLQRVDETHGPLRAARRTRAVPGTALLIVALAAVTAGLSLRSTAGPASDTASLPSDQQAPSTPASSSGASGSPATSEPLPSTVESEPVIPPGLAAAAVQKLPAGQSILVSGWFGPPTVRSCPIQPVDASPALNPCASLSLLDGPGGDQILQVYPGHAVTWSLVLPRAGWVPVVISVHTHDGSCPSSSDDCLAKAVVDRLAWAGQVATQVGVPDSTPPPAGLDMSAAIGAARTALGPEAAGASVVTAFAGPYRMFAPEEANVSGGRWVWATTFTGEFAGPGCTDCPVATSALVIVDYVTGELVKLEAPAPTPPGS
jgi:hypothetical protein